VVRAEGDAVVALLERPLVLALICAGLVAAAELLHARRVRRVARLAFGPGRRPAVWARAAPVLRALSAGALVWGLATLFVLSPKTHGVGEGGLKARDGELRHVLLVLDVSPSMRLEDAGSTRKQSRMARARDVMESFFRRVPVELYRISVIATYNGALPVVVDTADTDVVRNILGDLPMHYAFPTGKTKLFEGLEEAAKLAAGWNPRSTTLIVVSDGDTIPAQGMPKMPAAVGDVLVVGVGDPKTGKFIDGRQSRQDVSALRQMAIRLGGTYHNGNELHLSSVLLAQLAVAGGDGKLEQLGRREYALIAAASGAGWIALLPLLLHLFGTAWRPGVRVRRAEKPSERRSRPSSSPRATATLTPGRVPGR